MKYLFFLFLLFATTTAHSQCSEFDNLLKKGDNYLKGSKPNYQEAINAFTAAILACSDRAGEAKQRITRMVNEINKLRENAQTALANLEKANADVVKLILENAERDIYYLRYEDALQKIKTAAGLGVLKFEVVRAYLEIAFWLGEAGNTQRANGILDSAGLLVGKKWDGSQPPRKSIEVYEPGLYKKLMERYYPLTVSVEEGTFNMGCDPKYACEGSDKKDVKSFQMAKCETTWWQYYLFCMANKHKYWPPSWGAEGDNPAVNVRFFDVVLYLNWVNKQFGLDTFYIVGNNRGVHYDDDYIAIINLDARKGYRLPTTAEWEYAAKGGDRPDKTRFSGSDSLDLVGWYRDNSGNRTHTVGKKKDNSLGLYDMTGNVWEWCLDWWHVEIENEPEGRYLSREVSSYREVRGGSWASGALFCHTTERFAEDAKSNASNMGFRLVFVP